MTMNMKAVFHVDAFETVRLNLTLNNIDNLLKEIDAETASLALLANGPAARLMTKEMDETFSTRISTLKEKGVRFYVCNNSLIHFEIEKEDLHPACEVVKAGVLKLVELQNDHFAYIKP